MALLETAILGIGSAIAKGVFRYWLGSESAPIQEHLWDNLLDVLKNKTDDVLAQRSADRQFQIIAEHSARNVIDVVNAEGDRLNEDRAEILIKMTGEIINQAVVSPSFIVENNLDPTRLTNYLITFGDAESKLKSLPESERLLFRELVYEASQHIIDIATELPSFTEASFSEILKREDLLLNQATRILEEIRRLRESTRDISAESAAFENDYRRDVSRRLDELQLFGVDVSSSSKRYKLSVAYVSLMVGQNKTQQLKDQYVDDFQETMKVDNALLRGERLFIRGPAGSGKTTLLQWIAITSASRSHTEPLSIFNDCIPFFIRLRALGDSLPTPEGLVEYNSPNIAGKMPRGWAHDKLNQGNAIVLVDGLDEVAEEKREQVKEWLKSFIDNFPKARYVVSTRPHAAKEGWLNSEGFVDTELQDMTGVDIQAFIHHWHSSVRSVESSIEKKVELDELEEKLSITLQNAPALRRLTTSPLLCALICALHRDRIENLPTRRVELYRACVDMFLRRDVERKIISDNYPQIDETQKRTILQELALWMMRGKLSQINIAEADQRIEITAKSLQSMPSDATGGKIRRLFIERSGILREPTIGKVDFPHRTFQEYLAAQAALDDMAISELIGNAHDDQWHETIILAAGLSRPIEAEELITGLIERGDIDKKNQHAIYLLAVTAQQGIIKLSSDSNIIRQLRKRLRKIVPPSNISEAKALVAVGDLVVPYLRYKKQVLKQAVPSIRCLALIDTEVSLREIEAYAKDQRRGILEELERSQKYVSDPDGFARRFLYHHWFGFISDDLKCKESDISLSYKQVRDITQLKFCTELQKLSLRDTLVFDIKPLAECTKLQSLDLTDTLVSDLSPLTSCTQLESIQVSRTKVTDFSALSSCEQLEKIDLLGMKNPDLSSLVGCKNIKSLDLSASINVDISPLKEFEDLEKLNLRGIKGLNFSDLKELSNLKSLQLSGYRDMDLSFLSDCSKVESLSMIGLSAIDISPLKKCKQLKYLDIHGARNIDFSPLDGCVQLEELRLWGIEEVDVSLFAGCRNLKVVVIGQSKVTGLSSLSNFTKLRRLKLYGSSIDDSLDISNCTQLEFLDLSRTGIEDVSSLSGSKQLIDLDLSHTEINDLSPLSSCARLEFLDLKNTPIYDISPLSTCIELKGIVLWNTSVADVSSLICCKKLESLDLDSTLVTDVSPLTNCENLRILDLRRTKIKDLSPLHKLIRKGLHVFR